MKSLIRKLISNTITEQELQELNQWLIDPKNQSVLETYIKDYHDLNLAMLKNNLEEAFKKVTNKIEENQKNSKVIPFYKRNLFKYAAVGLILITTYFLFSRDSQNTNTPIIVNNTIEIGTNKAILTLEDGTKVTLEKGQNYTSKNITSNGEELIYNNSIDTTVNQTIGKHEIAYNYLTIPRGGEYFIKLSDGTQVWLNSESKLKYPVTFIEGETRQVELVYGEAYFDVSPSTNHKGSNFKVTTGIQEVDVLGTEFNIKAYSDEEIIYTTLVEGQIAVGNTNDYRSILKPNQQFILNSNTKETTIKKVNILTEVSWVKGDFVFERKPLKQIAKVLSRWYDIDVIFMDKTLETIEFTGEFGKYQKIEEILTLINKTNIISAYEINKNTIKIQ